MFTFWYGQGAAYLVDDPAACANCHIMQEQFTGWLQGSHRAAATCNDCHTPKSLVGKYVTKADNGFWHSFAFTSGRFPATIRIKDRNRAVTEGRCRNCHTSVVAMLEGSGAEAIDCLRCHADVGHRT